MMLFLRSQFHLFFVGMLLIGFHLSAASTVTVGVDHLFKTQTQLLKGKCIGLITNHTAINADHLTSVQLFKANQAKVGYKLKALFAPEHGLTGIAHAAELVADDLDEGGIPIYSLHGTSRRPAPHMLKGIDLLVYDIQDIGSRSYTYISTLFYVMEAASAQKIPVMVLDRPNPINGLTVDGPMLEEGFRSFVGYINVPYCHGLTVGELAQLFNQEYKIGCQLKVVPMQGWKRTMTFKETGLPWVPLSPHVPEPDTPLYYPTTGLLGELKMVNMGVGYTLPFKVIGAPWLDADLLATKLNEQGYPGVYFMPFHYKPFFGHFKQEVCHGVLIQVTDPQTFLPVTTQYLLMGMLKTLYSEEFLKALTLEKKEEDFFNKVCGTGEVLKVIRQEKYISWKLRDLHRKEREEFIAKRQKYWNPVYAVE